MKNFKYKTPITRVLKRKINASVHADRFMDVDEWVAASFGPLNAHIEYVEDPHLIGQGDWMLFTNCEEDIAAFRLKWGFDYD